MRRDVDHFDDALRRLAAGMEAEVPAARAEQIAARAIARARRPRDLPRWVAAAASTSFLVVSLTGLGIAADAAVPGDALYRLDRSVESVADALGVGGDRSVERLEEIIALADRGDVERAAATAVEVLEGFGVAPPAVEPTTSTSAVPETVPDPVPDSGAASEPPAEDPSPDAATLAAPEPDRAQTIRLAAERLLRTVRGAGGEREAAVAELAVAAGVASEPGTTVKPPPASPPPTTTSTIPGSTTTVPPAGDGTTAPDGTDGGSTDDSGTSAPTTTVPDGPGPIILPPLS